MSFSVNSNYHIENLCESLLKLLTRPYHPSVSRESYSSNTQKQICEN